MSSYRETGENREGLLICFLSNYRQHCCKCQKNRFTSTAAREAPVLTLINTIFLKGWQNVNRADFVSDVSRQPNYTNALPCCSALLCKTEENRV